MSSVSRCEDRINLYPAAPIRLATMGRAWTIWIQARIIPPRNLDRQKPAVLAQLKGTMERLFARGGRRGRRHSISLLPIAIEPIEGS